MNKEEIQEMQEKLKNMMDLECAKKEEEYTRYHKNHKYFDKDTTGIATGIEVIIIQNRVIIEQLKIIAEKI